MHIDLVDRSTFKGRRVRGSSGTIKPANEAICHVRRLTRSPLSSTKQRERERESFRKMIAKRKRQDGTIGCSKHLEVFLVDVMERTCDQLSERRCRASRVDVQKAKESREPSGKSGQTVAAREKERQRESGKAGRLSHEVSRPIRGDARNGGRVCTHDTVKLPRQKQLRYSPTVRVTRPRDNEEERSEPDGRSSSSSSLSKCDRVAPASA